jgi:hypothetical protein
MNLRLIGAVAGLAISVIASQASATVVNFNSLGPGAAQFGPEYQEGGLTFTSSDPQSTSFGNWGSGTSENADPTGATLFPNWTLTTMTVALTGGGTFDLASIDLADVINLGISGPRSFTYVDSGGSHSLVLNLDDTPGLQTFALNLNDISSFSLPQDPAFTFQIDNIVFNEAAVPELSTWAMMILGFAGVGFMAYRRRNQTTALRAA